MICRHAGHKFTYIYRDLHWQLEGEKEHRAEDFLRFLDPIVTIFALHGRFFVVVADGSIREMLGFNGKDTDYEQVRVSLKYVI